MLGRRRRLAGRGICEVAGVILGDFVEEPPALSCEGSGCLLAVAGPWSSWSTHAQRLGLGEGVAAGKPRRRAPGALMAP